MRVALTGAAGFIGRKAHELLSAAGHEVTASDLEGRGNVAALDLCDRAAVLAFIRSARPDVVVHSGAISGPMLARDDPCRMFDVNAGGTLNLLEAMRTTGTRRMILLSSIAVYGPRGDTSPVPETAALHSYEPYSASKIAAEAMLEAFVASFGLAGVSLRVSTVYGPGRATPYIIADLIRAGLSGGRATVSGMRDSMRQYVHVDDVAQAILLAVATPLARFVPLNITGGSYVSEAEVAEAIKRRLPRLAYDADPGRAGGDGDFGPLDIDAARRLIGFRPEIPLEAGLERLIEEWT